MHLSVIGSVLTTQNYIDFLCRIFASVICGGIIGFEREKRFKSAGLGTHMIVCLAASIMMIVSKYAFMDIVGLDGMKIQLDGSRIAASAVQAIGFIGVGVVVVKKENTLGLTTAAGLWATVGIGLALGAGMYLIGFFATATILVIQWALHHFHIKYHTFNMGLLTTNITKRNMSYSEFRDRLSKLDLKVRDISVSSSGEGTVVSVIARFKNMDSSIRLIDSCQEGGLFDSIQLNPTIF